MSSPICFAADFPTLGDAANFLQEHQLTHEQLGAIKVGLELYIASGPRSIEVFSRLGLPVVLDLKLHDIPETVSRAVKAGGDLGTKFMTLHIQQRKTLEMAVKAAEPFGITLLGVTVLTSNDGKDLMDLRMPSHLGSNSSDLTQFNPSERAENLSKFGYECGLRGFVCSPQEVGKLKTSFADAFFLVPGVRPAGSETGDQKRVGTPGGAVADGANLIVVGRPIRDAKNPKQAAEDILKDVQAST